MNMGKFKYSYALCIINKRCKSYGGYIFIEEENKHEATYQVYSWLRKKGFENKMFLKVSKPKLVKDKESAKIKNNQKRLIMSKVMKQANEILFGSCRGGK